jgi:carboxymethylenebutenolidase
MPSPRPRLPNEAIELYNRYIHGEIGRREFLNGAKRFAVAGLTVGAVVEALMPDYAAAQQVSKTDDRIKASYVTVASIRTSRTSRGGSRSRTSWRSRLMRSPQ